MTSQLDGGDLGPLRPKGGGNVRLPPATTPHPTPGPNSQRPPGPSAQLVPVGLPSSWGQACDKVLQWRLQ